MFEVVSGAAARGQVPVGTWANVDPNARMVHVIRIDGDRTRLRVRAWGKCVPRDCPWGSAEALVYDPDGDVTSTDTARVISATFVAKASETLVLARLTADGTLRLDMFRHYTDGSGRPNVRDVAVLRSVPGT